MRIIWALALLGIIGGIVFYILTIPSTIDASALPSHKPDIKNGEYYFNAGGCASCHAAPAGKSCDNPGIVNPTELKGGRCLKTPFGIFYVPNISPDPKFGIGGWSDQDFINAMVRGVAPDGSHYYPAFPYTSYQKMNYKDLIDLKAYIDQLPAVSMAAPPHELLLPFRFRRGVGLWKQLFLDKKPFVSDPQKTDQENRGAYLVQGPGHCGECHSPRNIFGGIDKTRQYSGGPAPEGDGFIPNITPHKDGIGDWSAADIAEALATGFTPSFDTLGGTMTEVQNNMSKLTNKDRAAIAAYLKAIPAIPTQRAGKPAS